MIHVISNGSNYQDAKYVLRGLIENGYEVNMPDYKHALRVIRWIEKTMRANDFVRAVGTAHKYRFRSFPKAVRINA